MNPTDVLRPLVRDDDRIAVTGASGWFGRVALDLLDDLLGHERAAETVTAYASREREIHTSLGRRVDALPLRSLVQQSSSPTVILHFGFLTRDRAREMSLGSYLEGNLTITATVLEALVAHNPRALVVASSGAVYADDSRRLTTDLASNPYGTLKHLDELAFRSAAEDAGTACVIPRIFSVGGPHMTKVEQYALGEMIRMALSGGPLHVRAPGRVFRSYVGVDEVIAVAVWAALSGRSTVFDTGAEVVEVEALAHAVASEHGISSVAVLRTFDPAAPVDRYVGDARAMNRLVREAGLRVRSLPELIRETSRWIAQQKGEGSADVGAAGSGS